MLKTIMSVCCVLITLCCMADILVTLDGKKYVDYQIMSPKHHGLEIMHSEGIATVPYDKLPVNLQQKYAEKAKQLKAAENARKKQAEERKKQQKENLSKMKQRAWDAAVYFISKDLKSPRTAIFPSFKEYIEKAVKCTGENKFYVRGFVDAKNSFGAEVRTEWYCKLEYNPQKKEWSAKYNFL